MNTSENKSFCILPWMNISVDPDGNIKPCCVSHSPIKKEDGTNYNLGYDKLEDIINSPSYVNIRQQMVDGELVKGCEECYKQEEYGGNSMRIYHTGAWQHIPSVASKLSNLSNTIPNQIEYFDLRFGNLCNLNCRSCGPKNSSQLTKELNEIRQIDKRIEKHFFMNLSDYINDWYKTPTFDDNIKSQVDNIRVIYITGGEPTLIEKNYEILEYLVAQGKSSEIFVHLNTNLTNIKPRLLNLISKFKYVLMFVSVDGYKEVQEYIRYPSDWSQIDKNMKMLIDLKAENMMIIVNPVIQNTNLEHIVDLFEYMEQFNRDADKTIVHISPTILSHPEHMDLKYLPIEYKKQCWEKIEQWLDNRCSYQKEHLTQHMLPVKLKCLDDIEYQHKLDEFREFTEIFDTHRNVKLSDINPSLYKILYK